jgi:CheY-like chemotaxis protein
MDVSESRTRVLVVDDSKDGADSMAAVIQMLGGETQVAYDGLSAIAAMSAFQPSIVLLDISMPGMDGFEVARQTRANAALTQPKLIALTGWGTEEEQRRTREAGFDEHWVKPVAPERLRALLKPAAPGSA